MPARTPLLPALFASLLLVSPLGASETPAAATTDPVAQAWRDATLYLFKESGQGFREQTSREGRLGRGTLLLVQQPKTEANLNAAAREFESLIAEGANDDVAAASRYLLGRVAHVHRFQPDLGVAAQHYRALVSEQPGHLLADHARIKLALIELHQPGLSPERAASLIDAFGEEADALARASSRRDFHLLLAAAALHHRLGDERPLRHYLAADQAGGSSPTARANNLVAIGELASRVGRHELAREYFERFLAEFQRDNRRALVRSKIAALPASSTPATR